MQHECRIAVIDKKCFTDYQEQYLADPKSGPCPFLNAGKTITGSYTAEIELRPVTGGTIKRQFDQETGTGFWCSLLSENNTGYNWMTVDEARHILQAESCTSLRELRRNYLRLMKECHPDNKTEYGKSFEYS